MSVLLSSSVLSNSLKTHGLPCTRLPCPSLSPGACSDSCPLSRHPTISSSVIPSPPAFNLSPASVSFLVSQFFASGGQSTEASAWASVLPMNIQGWFALGLTGLIFFLSKGLSRIFSRTTIWKHRFFGALLSLWSNFHIHTWRLEYHSFDYM